MSRAWPVADRPSAASGDGADAASPRPEPDRTAPQERTALAWRRTGLALLVGALTIGRLTLDTLGPVVVGPAVLGAALAAWVVAVSLRSRRMARTVRGEPAFSVLADGRLPAAVALLVGALALGELVAALVALA